MECYRDSFTHLLESSWCIAFETCGMSIPSQCQCQQIRTTLVSWADPGLKELWWLRPNSGKNYTATEAASGSAQSIAP